MPKADQRPNGTPWTFHYTERFFRGAYKLWLFGYLFAPICFWEPIVQGQRKSSPPSFHPLHRLPYWGFASHEPFQSTYNYLDYMRKYPMYMGSLNSQQRLRHVVPLFRGFTNWLVRDGEKRLDCDVGDEKTFEAYLDQLEQRSRQNGFPREGKSRPSCARQASRTFAATHHGHVFRKHSARTW